MTNNLKIMTEALYINDGKILLGQRKKKGFGQGKLLGLGGKLDKGESIEQAMTRECQEEAGITVSKFIKRGVLTFYYANDPDMEVHYFEILDLKGIPADSEEMAIKWFDIDKIPYRKMWPNDRYWLPLFLKKKFFTGEFHFDANYNISKYKIDFK